MSKGSSPRPVDKKKFDDSYDRIFGKKDQQPKEPKNEPRQ